MKISEIKEKEINEFLNLYPYIINLKLSLKNKDEVLSISNVKNEIRNSKKMLSNIVFEIKYLKLNLNYNKSMSFLLVGDSPVGKSSFLRRFNNKGLYESHIAAIGLNNRMK